MSDHIHGFLHRCKRLLIQFNKAWMRLIPKKKNLILLSAWFGQKYQDNAMFMYEFLQEKPDIEAVWFTRNKDIYDQLRARSLPVVFGNTLKAIWTQIRAKMLVSAVQFVDFNEYFLGGCIFIDLGHGFPNKQIGFKQPDFDEKRKKFDYLLRKNIDFFMTAASPITRDIQMDTYDLDKDHVLYCNKPRTDVLFDPSLRSGKNRIIDEIKGDNRAIVYMPTHRSCGKVNIDVEKIFDLDAIEEICKKNNAVFIIKKHYYHAEEKADLSRFERIFDITQESIDTQTLLYQADVIVSDYSSAYIDYLLLDRPVILYTYDLESYLKKERGLYLGINENHVGFKPCSREEFNEALESVCSDWKDEQHRIGRNALRSHYFSDAISVGNAREEVYEIIQELLQGNYMSRWEEGV